MITPNELQIILNQFEGLEGLEVTGRDGVILTKHNPATIKGAIRVYGEYYAYELSIDLNDFKNADDVLNLVGKLNKAFDQIRSADTRTAA